MATVSAYSAYQVVLLLLVLTSLGLSISIFYKVFHAQQNANIAHIPDNTSTEDHSSTTRLITKPMEPSTTTFTHSPTFSSKITAATTTTESLSTATHLITKSEEPSTTVLTHSSTSSSKITVATTTVMKGATAEDSSTATMIIASTASSPQPYDSNSIPPAPVIAPGDEKFAGFQKVDTILQTWMNISVNPCDDFYQFVCGKGRTARLPDPEHQSIAFITEKLMTKYRDEEYFKKLTRPMQQLKHVYDKCVNSDATEKEASFVKRKKIEALIERAGIDFPMIHPDKQIDVLTPQQLGKLLGLTISEMGVHPLVEVNVQEDYKFPDQMPARVYVAAASVSVMDADEVFEDCKKVAALMGVTSIDEKGLKNDVIQVVELEKDFFNGKQQEEDEIFMTYNLWTLSKLQTAVPAIDWIELIKAALIKANASERITPEMEVIILDPEALIERATKISDSKTNVSTIVNYIYYAATIGAEMFVVENSQNSNETIESRKLPSEAEIIDHLKGLYTAKELLCLKMTSNSMVHAANRLYADAAFPTPQAKQEIKQKAIFLKSEETIRTANWHVTQKSGSKRAAQTVQNERVTQLGKYVLSGFREQLNTLDWMTTATKQAAYDKLEKVQLNVAFPEWITDDALLSEYYKDLEITNTSSAIEVQRAIREFDLLKSVENFKTQKRLKDFDMFVGVTNSQYTPKNNAMYIFGGMLHDVYYNDNYPAAFNFGATGNLLGHELIHGFDDNGVLFDSTGGLSNWMDAQSMHNFQKMAACVIREYFEFCPLNNTTCVNGTSTLGENIADNGGMQASYKAFKAYEAYNGPDPRLPSQFGRVFNSDQLYFIGFAYSWCEEQKTEKFLMKQLHGDVHSPSVYRVRGTLQNFPAFRAAFNCPVGKNYTPEDHCKVWTTADP